MSSIIDITQPLSKAIAVWPGDTEFKPFRVLRIADGDSVNLGSLTMSLHTGTHTDAPYHIVDDGHTTTDLPLEPFLGEALLIDLSNALKNRRPAAITADDIEPHLPGNIERLLIRTDTSDAEKFIEDAAHFSPDAARLLVQRGVILVGIDTPSLDSSDSKELPVHHTFINGGMCWLENLALSHVSPGRYELVALPLKLIGMDGAPVRAILRTL